MVREIDSGETRKLTEKEFREQAKKTLENGSGLVIVTDVDLTLTDGSAEDPRDTEFIAKSGQALALLEQTGQFIAINSKRAGADIARMARTAQLINPVIIGTSGIELFEVIPEHIDGGIAKIDERFDLYADGITGILKPIHTELLRGLGINDNPFRGIYEELRTENGIIIVEHKGKNERFPLGAAMGINMNRLQRSARIVPARIVQEQYNIASKAYMQPPNHLQAMALMYMWGMIVDEWDPAENERYSIKFEPNEIKRQPKLDGVKKALEIIKQRITPSHPLGMIIVAGDDDPDAAAIKGAREFAAKLAEKAGQKDMVPVSVIGINVRQKDHKQLIEQAADFSIDGPHEYASLLTNLAGLAVKYTSGDSNIFPAQPSL